jgi:hypothetical protein
VPTRPEVARAARAEGPLIAMLLVFWIVSVVRVAGAILSHEAFGAEATLALMAAVGIPWAGWRAFRSGRERAASDESSRSR